MSGRRMARVYGYPRAARLALVAVAVWRKCDTLPLWRCAELWVRRDRGGRTDRLDDAPGSRRDPRPEHGNGIEPADLARKDCCHRMGWSACGLAGRSAR
jgi:hypothetical protein